MGSACEQAPGEIEQVRDARPFDRLKHRPERRRQRGQTGNSERQPDGLAKPDRNQKRRRVLNAAGQNPRDKRGHGWSGADRVGDQRAGEDQ